MADFGTPESVAAWVQVNEPGGLEKLRAAVMIGTIVGTSRNVAIAFLDKHDRDEAAIERAAQSKATREAVEAAQSSAKWTAFAAIAAALGAIATAVQAWLSYPR
jgi:hypothetical protein